MFTIKVSSGDLVVPQASGNLGQESTFKWLNSNPMLIKVSKKHHMSLSFHVCMVLMQS